MAAAGAHDPLSRWKGSRPSASWRSSPRSRAHLRLLRALRADFRAAPIRPRHPHRLSRLPRPRGRGGAARRAPRCSTTLRRSSGPGGRGGPAGSPRRSTGWRSCSRSSSASSAGSGSGATTSATRWWTGAPGPREPRPARGSAFRADSRVLGIFPGQPARRRSAGSGARSATPRCRLLDEGRCDRVLVAGTAERRVSRSGAAHDPPRRPDPGLRRGRCGARQVRHHDARGRARGRADGGRLQGAPADLAACSSGCARSQWVSLVNLVAEREVVPEMLQDQAEAGPAGRRARGRCSIPATRGTVAQREGLALVRERLGAPGAADAGGGTGRRAARRVTTEGLAVAPRARFAGPGVSACSPRPGGSGRCTRSGGAPLYEARRPLVFLLWHEALLPLLWQHRRQAIAIVVSEARDGQYLADFAAVARLPDRPRARARAAARGPCSAPSASSEAGYAVAFTPDGPRGPRREIKPGVVAAAQRGGRGHRAAARRGRPGLAVRFVGPVPDPEAGRRGADRATAARSRWPPATRGSRRGLARGGGATARRSRGTSA